MWRGVLTRFRASGLSVRAFCRQERLSEPSFYAWRRTIHERDAGSKTVVKSSKTVQKRASAARPRKQPAFLPIVVQRDSLASQGAGISLELRGGRTLRLPESIPVERLAAIIQTLETQTVAEAVEDHA
jgi:transposase-like protein